MVIRINKEFCKGCGFCIEFCPKKVYELSDELNSKGYQLPRIARPDDCSACGQCDLYCPEFAIVLEEGGLKHESISSKAKETRRVSRGKGRQNREVLRPGR